MEDHDDDAPPLLVMQITRHWETYLPKLSRDLKAKGLFEETVNALALEVSDQEYKLVAEHGLNQDQARELVREQWAFSPGEDEEANP